MSNKIKLLVAKYIGSYNDTTIYEAILEFNNTEIKIEIEEHYHDMKKHNKTWEVISSENITAREKEEIIKEIVKNRPILYSDVSPRIYNKEIEVKSEKKNMKEWKESSYVYLTDYLKIGDMVDKDILEYIMNSIPPKTMTGNILQGGEPYSSDKDGKNTYITFAKENPFGEWYYKGACLKGETENKEKEFELFTYMEEDYDETEIL